MIIPNIWEKKNVPNHQPANSGLGLVSMMLFIPRPPWLFYCSPSHHSDLSAPAVLQVKVGVQLAQMHIWRYLPPSPWKVTDSRHPSHQLISDISWRFLLPWESWDTLPTLKKIQHVQWAMWWPPDSSRPWCTFRALELTFQLSTKSSKHNQTQLETFFLQAHSIDFTSGRFKQFDIYVSPHIGSISQFFLSQKWGQQSTNSSTLINVGIICVVVSRQSK